MTNPANLRPKSSLPLPEDLALAHSKEVEKYIRQQVRQALIPFSRFMELALYAPGLGYYSAGAKKLGHGGDFVTAPEISPLYSRCIAKQCLQVLSELKKADILEFGAGTGTMAAEILLELERCQMLPEHYFILELSADLKERQQQLLSEKIPHLIHKVRWLSSLAEQKITGIILANEVLDAMPVSRFKIVQGQVREFYITCEEEKLTWMLQEASGELRHRVLQLGCHFENDYESEMNLFLPSWIKTVSDILIQGVFLIIDYGFPRHEYYHPDRDMGTLMCHFKQHAHGDPLIYPGIQDITAHVDFTAVAESGIEAGMHVAGYTNQTHFLLNCGIAELMMASSDALNNLDLANQVKILTLPSEMGELFKVMALSKNYQSSLLGFEKQDLRAKLS